MANGIPSLLNQVGNVVQTASLLTSDFTTLFSPNIFKWGIYTAGTNSQIIVPESIASFGYKKEFKISDYPIEKGTFSQYNKVAIPFIATVRMMMGINAAARTNFLDTLDVIAGGTDLYDVATPEKVYLNANIIDYNYERTSTSGAGMIIVDIKLQEIRLTGLALFSKTQSSSDTKTANVGQVTASPPVSAPPQFNLPLTGKLPIPGLSEGLVFNM